MSYEKKIILFWYLREKNAGNVGLCWQGYRHDLNILHLKTYFIYMKYH